MSDQIQIQPVEWTVQREGSSEDLQMAIDIRIVDRGVEGQSAYAITRMGRMTYNKHGKWEYEPLPSARTEAYKQRCRWSDFDEAAEAARKAYLDQESLWVAPEE